MRLDPRVAFALAVALCAMGAEAQGAPEEVFYPEESRGCGGGPMKAQIDGIGWLAPAVVLGVVPLVVSLIESGARRFREACHAGWACLLLGAATTGVVLIHAGLPRSDSLEYVPLPLLVRLGAPFLFVSGYLALRTAERGLAEVRKRRLEEAHAARHARRKSATATR